MSDDERDRSRERAVKRERPTRFSDQARDRSVDRGGKDRGGMKSSLCRVYVSNIPYEYRWQDLKDLFRSQVGDVSFVELFVDANDKARGCGIVEFSDTDSVKKCLEVMHRFELKGRKLVIKEDFGNQRDKYGNLVGSSANKRAREDSRDNNNRYRDDHRSGYESHSNNRGTVDDGKWGNTYGLSPQFLESLGIDVPLINRVFIANLDYKVDKKKLKEVFRLAGKVQRIDLSTDRDGKSRGFAVLEYDHPVEAVQSISMFHNQILFDRTMTVRMDRDGDRVITKIPVGLKGIGMGLGVNGEPLRDVTRNLPSISSVATQSTNNAGAGILGAVPNMQLGLGNALNNLGSVNTSALSNAAVLQNLAGVGGLSSNLLASSLGSGDLSLAASLVNNPLVQNQSLAALTNSANMSRDTLNNSNFNRNDNYLGGGGVGGMSNVGNQNSGANYQNSVLSQNQNYLNNSGRGGGAGGSNSGNYDDQKTSGYGNFNSSDRDSRNNSNNVYSTVNNGSQLIRSNVSNLQGNKSNTGGYSNKILIGNLPPTASYKMLTEKCNEFGDVQRVEDKGSNGVLVAFATEWEAERAIKNMDRARIDGRTIDVRFFY